MSSSLLQSRRLSSSFWSGHTLITCMSQAREKLEVSMVQLGGSKAQRAPTLARDPQWGLGRNRGKKMALSQGLQPLPISPHRKKSTVKKIRVKQS